MRKGRRDGVEMRRFVIMAMVYVSTLGLMSEWKGGLIDF